MESAGHPTVTVAEQLLLPPALLTESVYVFAPGVTSKPVVQLPPVGLSVPPQVPIGEGAAVHEAVVALLATVHVSPVLLLYETLVGEAMSVQVGAAGSWALIIYD